MREIILDTETTGLCPFKGKHKIVEIGCIEVKNKIRTGNHFHVYINPERDVPYEAYRVHGISTEFLLDKPKFLEIADQFLEFISDSPLVIHNAAFDIKFLNAELKFIGKNMIKMSHTVDTLMLARKKFPGSPASLDALCKRFNIDLSKREKHGALLDCELLADVYLELMGGKQTSIEFSLQGNQEREAHEIYAERKVREPRNFQISNKELEDHKKLLEKINAEEW